MLIACEVCSGPQRRAQMPITLAYKFLELFVMPANGLLRKIVQRTRGTLTCNMLAKYFKRYKGLSLPYHTYTTLATIKYKLEGNPNECRNF